MKKQLQKYIDYAIAKKTALEIYYQESKEQTVEIRQNKVEKISSALDCGYAIKVIKNNKMGFSYTTSNQEEDILATINNAIAAAENNTTDKNWSLPKPGNQTHKKNLQLYDENIEKLTGKQKIKLAQEIEKAAYQYNKKIKKTESASFATEIVESWLINSNGVSVYEKNSSCGGSLEIIAQEKNKMEAAYDYSYVTHLSDFKPATIGKNAAKKAVEMLAAVDIQTGKYTLLLPPKTAIDFLSVILPMFFANNIQKHKSLLANKINQKIASKLITIIDNPLLPKGLGSYHFDAEGIAGKKKILVKDGILKSFLYDTYSANKESGKSTGNALRYSLKAEPSIGPSNFYIKPSQKSPQAIIKNIDHGIIIKSLMGLHTADPISGQFSLGASGQLIEKGKPTTAVKNIAVAGNLLDLLQKITAVGNDLCFMPTGGSLGSPSLVIADIQVSGNQ